MVVINIRASTLYKLQKPNDSAIEKFNIKALQVINQIYQLPQFFAINFSQYHLVITHGFNPV